jgi:uncharacterized membrane protein YfhO
MKMELLERPYSLNLYNEDEIKEAVDNEIISISNGSVINEQAATIEQLSLQNFQDTSADVIDEPDSLNDEISGTTSTNAKHLKNEINNENKRTTSPSCSQEVVVENQQLSTGHLDLKFYHSPLW